MEHASEVLRHVFQEVAAALLAMLEYILQKRGYMKRGEKGGETSEELSFDLPSYVRDSCVCSRLKKKKKVKKGRHSHHGRRNFFPFQDH